MTTTETLSGWFAGRVDDQWFTEAPTVRVDREEIQVVGRLAEPKVDADASDDTKKAAVNARIDAHRESTRDARIRIAEDAEAQFGRKVSWGVSCGDETRMFTVAAVPVMSRLRFDERAVLDTLIDAGAARSRSEALAWCVKLVGKHQADWIASLREALEEVERVRRSLD